MYVPLLYSLPRMPVRYSLFHPAPIPLWYGLHQEVPRTYSAVVRPPPGGADMIGLTIAENLHGPNQQCQVMNNVQTCICAEVRTAGSMRPREITVCRGQI